MTTEWGALAGVFPCDALTVAWLRGRLALLDSENRNQGGLDETKINALEAAGIVFPDQEAAAEAQQEPGEEDAEEEAPFIALDKQLPENAKEVNAQLTGEGGVKLEDLWGAEEEDTTLNHKDKDAILKLKEKIEVRDVYAAQHPPLAFAVLRPIALSRQDNGPVGVLRKRLKGWCWVVPAGSWRS